MDDVSLDAVSLDAESTLGPAKEWNYTVSMATSEPDDVASSGATAAVASASEMPDMQQNHERTQALALPVARPANALHRRGQGCFASVAIPCRPSCVLPSPK